ncbi:hypothetical protein ACQ4PT_001312 [Festuca glaucescens]
MPSFEPAPGEGGQTEAADTADSVNDSANPEAAEAEVEAEEKGEDEPMVDDEEDDDAVGSPKVLAVPEEECAEEDGEEHKADDLVDAAPGAVESVDVSAKAEGNGVEEEVEEHEGDALVDVSVADQVKGEAQENEGTEMKDEAQENEEAEMKDGTQGNEEPETKDDTQGNETAEMEVDKAGNGDGHTEVKVDGDNGSSLKEESDIGGDNKKDANGKDQPMPAPAGEDGDQNLSDNVSNSSFMFDYTSGGDDSGTEEEQAEFIKELERFYTTKLMEFKAPKFYGEGLNCLKLWRQVTGLGGYDQVTSCKLWRQVGESFKPPKTCTTVSWTFRNFYEKKDCYEVYALVPGLLREEVHVQSDPAGRLIVTGEPEQLDNPWGVTPFKKVISLPSRIDPHQTSAVVTLHGQLFVRAPFEQSKS